MYIGTCMFVNCRLARGRQWISSVEWTQPPPCQGWEASREETRPQHCREWCHFHHLGRYGYSTAVGREGSRRCKVGRPFH